jgi:hypothetical protein
LAMKPRVMPGSRFRCNIGREVASNRCIFRMGCTSSQNRTLRVACVYPRSVLRGPKVRNKSHWWDMKRGFFGTSPVGNMKLAVWLTFAQTGRWHMSYPIPNLQSFGATHPSSSRHGWQRGYATVLDNLKKPNEGVKEPVSTTPKQYCRSRL